MRESVKYKIVARGMEEDIRPESVTPERAALMKSIVKDLVKPSKR